MGINAGLSSDSLDENNGIHVQCELRYINHSVEPNAAYFDNLEVCAVRDIAPHEEITHDYGAGWQIFPPADVADLCKIDAAAEAHLDATIHVLDENDPIQLFSAGINADTRLAVGQVDPTYDAHLVVLNNPVWQTAFTNA